MSAPPERAKNDHISRKYLAGDGGLKVSYNIGVEQLPPRQRGVIFYIEQHKGGLTLALSAVFYAASWAVSLLSPWHTAGALMRSVGEAALVGGLCDYIALKMIFERRWYLPNSGVLPRNRQKLINGISSMIENQWLTPKMIEDKLRDLDLVKRLGRYLEGVSLESIIDRTHLAALCESIARYMESDQLTRFLEERMQVSAPRSIRMANALGLMTYHKLSERIGQELRGLLRGLPNNADLIEALEERIHSLGDELQQPSSTAYEAAYRIVDTLVEHSIAATKGQIALTVKENLNRLDDDEIRRQIESRTRTHLDWIRVNGGIFGALFGALFGLLNYAVAHSASLIALVRAL
jgi:uncharacterized membrane-anchored protein YjiN (DUF445 family)